MPQFSRPSASKLHAAPRVPHKVRAVSRYETELPVQSVVFPNKILPYFLVAPQIILTVVFFFWPASQALYQSAMREDPFGLQSTFVGFGNFAAILADENYL